MTKSLLLLASLLFTLPAFGQYPRHISVRGEGEVKIAPDKAIVSLQVQAKAKDAKSAQAMNAKEMARVEKVLKSDFKIDGKDIQTSGFSVQPEYRYEQNGRQVFQGFLVSHGLTVTVKRMAALGEILDQLVGKGSESLSVVLHHVSFDTEKRKEAEIQALEAAMGNAKARADALARFSKRSIKGVLRISDSSVQVAPPPFAFAGRMESAKMAADMGGTQIQGGEIAVTSQVAVDYEME